MGTDGAITGIGKMEQSWKRMEEMLQNKYATTLHIDNESVLLTQERPEDFELSGDPKNWSAEIIDIVKGIHSNEKQK